MEPFGTLCYLLLLLFDTTYQLNSILYESWQFFLFKCPDVASVVVRPWPHQERRWTTLPTFQSLHLSPTHPADIVVTQIKATLLGTHQLSGQLSSSRDKKATETRLSLGLQKRLVNSARVQEKKFHWKWQSLGTMTEQRGSFTRSSQNETLAKVWMY